MTYLTHYQEVSIFWAKMKTLEVLERRRINFDDIVMNL